MLGTYTSALLVLGGSAATGQAIIALSGRRAWSPLAPAVGLAALAAVAWATVRLPGEGLCALLVLAALGIGSALYLRPRAGDPQAVLGDAGVVAVLALVAASLPFLVEGRFGILGTGLNPDMSQHLFAVDRLAAGGSERLISDGYPLGPHSIVVALAELGPSSVEAFDGLTLAVAIAACLAPLALLGDLARGWRIAAALVAGLSYLVAAYLVQGAFKETMQALFVATFAIGLCELARRWPRRGAAPSARAALPLAVLAVGSVYVYSFPGLAWLAGALAVWGLVELWRARRRGARGGARRRARLAAPAALAGLAVVAVAVAPEIGRMASFASFETFDPDGPGLGNLFNRISPLEALGIWPSGDFRVEPGDGAAPAILFYLGAALGAGALGFGLRWWSARGERAVPAALGAAGLLWLYSLVAGTPYQEAKALVLAAPLVALISARALVAGAPTLIAAAFLAAAGGSSVLALANGPVGPADYSPALAELRPELGAGSTLVVAPAELLDEEHGRDYLAWELRGNRICVEAAERPPRDRSEYARTLILSGAERARRGAIGDRGYAVIDLGGSPPGPCPLIPDGARADPSAAGR